MESNTPQDNTALAEACKTRGNELFNEQKYAGSVIEYTKAISFVPDSAVYYSNRAAAHIKMENFGSAIADATTALKIDPAFFKAYYRRGSAYLALGRHKDALKDFKQVAKIRPNDADARSKLNECSKVVKQQAFLEAISQDKTRLPSETVDLDSIEVESSYNGPVLGDCITIEFVRELAEALRSQKKLHKKYLFKLMLWFKDALARQSTLIDIDVPEDGVFTVCGDVHGQFYDLLNIFELNGEPSPSNPYLFNGDFVDRGSFSVEVIVMLMAWKCLYPTSFHLLRGNHESKNLNKIYGFEGEVRAKYNEFAYEFFCEIFNLLPLAAVLKNKVLIVHGGLFSKDGVKLSDIRAINRNQEPPSEGLMSELLWSDPQPMPGRAPSKRGVGVGFGPDVTKRFLDDNGLELLIRSHEVKEEGFEVEADGRLITVFSAPNYCDQMGNKGAFIRFNGSDMKPQPTSFTAVPHPAIRPMAYASSMNFLGM